MATRAEGCPDSGGAGGAEAEAHGRAAAGPGPGGHLTVLGQGQAADDEQADADAAEAAAVAGLALDEAVEDALVVAGGDADALVLDRHLDPARNAPYDTGADMHGAAVG